LWIRGEEPHRHDARHERAGQTFLPRERVILEPRTGAPPDRIGELAHRCERCIGFEGRQLGAELHVVDVPDGHASGLSRITM